VTKQLCDGLIHLHQFGIIHRDVKPSNIMLSVDGRVVLIDFGIAKFDSTEDDVTRTGQFYGTLAYSAPEALFGNHQTPATDTYAVAMTVLFMALGRDPYADVAFPRLITQITSGAMAKESLKVDLGVFSETTASMLAVKSEERPNLRRVVEVLQSIQPSSVNERVVIKRLVASQGSSQSSPFDEFDDTPTVKVATLDLDALRTKFSLIREKTVSGLLESLESQVYQVQAAVSNITASFAVSALKPREDGKSEMEVAIQNTFLQLGNRLTTTWKVSVIMTCVLFSLFVALVSIAAVMGLVYKRSGLSLLFGAGSAASVFTVILWRPIDKMLLVTVAIQQLDLIKINFQRALNGSASERSQAFSDVSAQLDSLLERVIGTKTSRKRPAKRGQ
jgi:serine/threonine protein kinase